MKKLLLVLTCTLMSLLSTHTLAQSLVNQDFTGATVGNASTASPVSWSTNGTGTGGSFLIANSSPLTYTGYTGGGGNYLSVTKTSSGSVNVGQTFTSTSGTNTYYYSFLLNTSTVASTASYFAALSTTVSSGSYFARLYMQSATGGYNLGISRGSGAASYGSTVLALNTTYLIVVKYVYVTGTTNDQAYVWVNPTITSEPSTASAEASDLSANIDGAALSANGIFTLRNNATNPSYLIDGIKVGIGSTSAAAYYDLAPSAPANTSGYPKTGNLASTSVDLTSNLTLPGKTYYVILPSTGTAPTTTAQIIAGTDGNGTAAFKSGSISVSTPSADATATISGLTASTAYNIYVVSTDLASNPSANVQTSFSTLNITTNAPPGDTTPPVNATNYPKANNATASTIDVVSNLNEVGTAYYVVLPTTGTAPTTSAQVKAGQDGNGNAVTLSGSFAVSSANADATKTVTGLTASTSYNVYVVSEDAVPNLQTSFSTLNITTTADVTPPVNAINYPKANNATSTTVDVVSNLNETGTTYYVALPATGTAPTTVAQVKAGQDGNGNTVATSGSFSVPSANTDATQTITGLTASTAYNIYVVSQDAAATPNVQTAFSTLNISTTAPPTPSIGTTGTLTALLTASGTASPNTSFSVSGANMTAGILVTAPTGFEVSTTSTSGFAGSVTVGAAGTIASTTVFVRLAASDAANTYSGNVVLTSSGATTVNVATASSTVTVTPIVAWDFNGNAGNEASVNAGTLNGSLSTSTITRGSSLTAASLSGGFSSSGFTASGDLVDAVTNNKYIQFTISANAGKAVSLSTLDVNIRRTSTGPNAYQWQYSLDGANFTNIGTPVSYTATTSNGDPQTQIVLSGISALQNVASGTTITFRIYAYGATSTGGTFALGKPTQPANDIAITGTVSVAPPTVSYTSPQTYLQNSAITALTPTSANVAAPGFATNAVGTAFARPSGVAMDASGNVYVADAGASSVYKMSSAGSGLTTIGSGIAGLGAIALDASGNMYVTEVTTGHLKKVTTGGVVTDIATFTMPTGVALDASGNIYVADQSTNKVSEIASGTTTVTDIATGLSTPFGLAVDASANIYVVNQGNGKLQKIDATTHAVTDIITISPGLTGLTMDGAGNLYYTNGTNHSVNEIAQGTTTSTQLSTGFTTPGGLVVDATGNVFAADAINGGSVYKVARTGGYYVTPALPAGLSMDGTTGAISGTPTVASAATNYTITGFNSAGGTSTTLNITVTGAPTINTTGTLSALSTTYGTASSAGTFSVSGTSLTEGILVTPPSGFEVSTDGTTYNSTVTVGAAGTVASTTVYIRLAATTAVGNSYSGNVVLSSSGASSVNVASVTSSVTQAPLTITANNANKTYGDVLTGAAGSTAFTAPGLKNSETIGTVTVAYGTGAAATDAVDTYTGQVTPSAATGGTFTASNYNITYAAGDIIVGKAPLSVTANTANKVYGNTLTGAAGSTAFTSSGLLNSETIGTVTLAYGTGSAATAAVNTYTGSVTPSAATGGTFNTSNYNITYHTGDIVVGAANLTITANTASKTYGATLTTGTGSTAFTPSGLANSETVGSVTMTYGTGSAATDAVNTYTGQATPSAATGGTFNANNYNITYTAGNIVVGKAALDITANNVTKSVGTTITGGTGSTAFTSTGLQNSETIGSVTIVYGAGSAGGDPPNTYTSSVGISGATGGTFTASNYTITYHAGNITVTSAPTPTISSTGTLSALTTTYGSASTSGTFSVSGANMSAGILITPPAGFEVSTDNSNFGSTVTLGAAGTISSTPVYIRLAAISGANTYSGNVVLSSSGAVNVNIATASSTVNKASLTITAKPVSKTYGQTLTSGSVTTSAFTVTGTLKNGETIAGATVTYGTGAAATASVNTYTGSVVPSAATGANGFLVGNYTITYVNNDISVTQAALTITANSASKTYGNTLTGGAGSTAFTSSGLQNSETIGSVTIAYGTGSAAIAAVNTYNGSVTPSAATGGTFAAGNYNITYTAGNIIVGKANLAITANDVNKTYGATLTGAAGSTAFTSTGLANSETIGSVTIAYGTGSAATAAVNTYTGSVTPSAATGGTFAAGNYNITYNNGSIVVGKANLTITANNVNKNYGVTLTGASGSTAFTSTGLANSETIGTITIAYGTGSTATDAVNTYTGSVTPSAATGGTFTVGNYNITYTAGNIIVGKANLTITANNVSKAYGVAITGAAGSTAFISAGLANSETIGSVTIAYGTGSAANAAGGTYNGSVMASAATGGSFAAANYTITYAAGNITVTPVTLTVTVSNATKVYGTANPAFAVNYVGFITGDNAASLTTQPAVSTTATATSGVGSYTLTAGGGVSSNYTFVYSGTGTLTITPAPLTITADAKTKAYNTANPTLTATYTGFAGTDNAASLTTQPTFATTAITSSLPGTYPITVSGAASPNYTITYVAGVLTVVPGNNANLSSLYPSSGSLSPVFASATLAYTDTVANSVDRISVTPTLSDPAANLQVNGTQVGSGNNSTFILLKEGSNTITILVTAQDGVTKNAYVVTVYRASAVSNITASNVMSPNGDGKNDNWVIKDINLYPNNNVTVYDRGGRVVYSKHGYTNDWSGTLRGAPLAEGTYYYTVQLDPKLPVIKGYITILRTR